jgi:hypothetical protein
VKWRRTKLNGQLDYLGAPPEIQINPADGAAAGVIDVVTGMVRYSGIPVSLHPA